jgi:hypothetical protein
MSTNLTDLKKARELVNHATHLLADARMNLDETLQNLDWAELDIVKHTKPIAEDMGLIEDDCSDEDYVALCQDIICSQNLYMVEDLTIEIMVDLLFWKQIELLISMRGITEREERLEYIKRWFPTLESKFFCIKPNLELSEKG